MDVESKRSGFAQDIRPDARSLFYDTKKRLPGGNGELLEAMIWAFSALPYGVQVALLAACSAGDVETLEAFGSVAALPESGPALSKSRSSKSA